MTGNCFAKGCCSRFAAAPSVLLSAPGATISWSSSSLSCSLQPIFRSSLSYVRMQPCPRSLLFCLVATMLFSLGPALKATKADLVNDPKHKSVSRRGSAESAAFSHQDISVMVQIALSLMLFFCRIIFQGRAQGCWTQSRICGGWRFNHRNHFSLIKKEPADSRGTILAMLQRRARIARWRATAVGTMLPFRFHQFPAGSWQRSMRLNRERTLVSTHSSLPSRPVTSTLSV